ncbi:MAG: hypothetical protein CBE35_00640 [Candidatus Pelagibacter sp. TMED275]|nr:MAG: hypothetical protein CBE35_00640 [Candidatus Pelagibacter sp. TMED275]|tara:strand:- start:1547 stop:1939 length:393 start_codon:yes stop_codon:yes gene_type:complete
MENRFLSKIISRDIEGLNLISACCHNAKVKIKNIKYLKNNHILLILLKRPKNEKNAKNQYIESICKFEFIDGVKSKNINQKDKELLINLVTIDIYKKEKNFEISLIFSDNAYITLTTEVIEATLEDKIND